MITIDNAWGWSTGASGRMDKKSFVIGPTLCPDLLRYEQIGQADTLRGRIVRSFFWLLRLWVPTP